MHHQDHAGLLIANELLGGFFGSRLMKNIREEKGFTYGIHSSIVNLKNDNFLVIATDYLLGMSLLDNACFVRGAGVANQAERRLFDTSSRVLEVQHLVFCSD